MATFGPHIEEDMKIGANIPQQKPFSKSYQELGSNSASAKPTQEAIAKAPSAPSKEIIVREKVRRSLIDGGYASAKVDEVMKGIASIPESLVNAYFEMVKEDVKNRTKVDSDYQAYKTEPRGLNLENLDKL